MNPNKPITHSPPFPDSSADYPAAGGPEEHPDMGDVQIINIPPNWPYHRYTPEEKAFYDRLVKSYGSEQALRDGYVQCSDLNYHDYTPQELEERLHGWIQDGVITARYNGRTQRFVSTDRVPLPVWSDNLVADIIANPAALLKLADAIEDARFNRSHSQRTDAKEAK